MKFLSAIAAICDTLNEWLGQAVSWLALGLVLMMTFNVMQRYAFNTGTPWQQELVRFFHATLFLAGAGYALKHEAHVRVDILYQRFGARGRAWVNLLGTIFLLWPVSFGLIYFSWEYVLGSWAIYEGSSEYKGMPGVFLLKSCIWVCGGVLIMQGVSLAITSLQEIIQHKPGQMVID
jgi:TRAP-type mannitol/chloroaromatic compound transport system permease small subunit